MFRDLLKRRDFLLTEMDKCRTIIDTSPPGKLEIYSNKTATRWYVKPENGEREYLPKGNFDTARLLSKKRIATEQLALYERELNSIEEFLSRYPNDEERLQASLKQSPFFRLAYPKEIKESKILWQNAQFETNTSFPENLKHPSPSGHLLRSKSECLIDMALHNRKIPFRYECQLLIGNQPVFPDFTIYKESTGEYKYWEHFGMIDDPRYRKHVYEKQELYFSHGFHPGIDLIFTYESAAHPLTVIEIDKIITEIEDWLG